MFLQPRRLEASSCLRGNHEVNNGQIGGQLAGHYEALFLPSVQPGTNCHPPFVHEHVKGISTHSLVQFRVEGGARKVDR